MANDIRSTAWRRSGECDAGVEEDASPNLEDAVVATGIKLYGQVTRDSSLPAAASNSVTVFSSSHSFFTSAVLMSAKRSKSGVSGAMNLLS